MALKLRRIPYMTFKRSPTSFPSSKAHSMASSIEARIICSSSSSSSLCKPSFTGEPPALERSRSIASTKPSTVSKGCKRSFSEHRHYDLTPPHGEARVFIESVMGGSLTDYVRILNSGVGLRPPRGLLAPR